MAKTQVCYCLIGEGFNPVVQYDARASYEVTPSASNQQVTASASTGWGKPPVARVATDTQVYAATGTNPDATTDAGRVLIPANGVEYLSIRPGDKVAITNG